MRNGKKKVKEDVYFQQASDPINEAFFDYAKSEAKSTKLEAFELDEYMSERLYPFKKENQFSFDILNWWRKDGVKFPTLRKMACDVLTILLSTVASESTFSCDRRTIDNMRSSLVPDNVEALVCTKDRLSSYVKDNDSNNIDKVNYIPGGSFSSSCDSSIQISKVESHQ